MISIVVVNWNSYDWLDLLIDSIEQFTHVNYEIIVVDNSELPFILPGIYKPNIIQIINGKNIGHGEGLNLGSKLVNFDYTMFVDVDCHFLCHNWHNYFLEKMKYTSVVAGRGVEQKPIRPSCMFMKTEIAKKYDWRSTPGYKGIRAGIEGTDVAIKAYYQMIKDSIDIELIDSKKNRYGCLNGEEWCIEDVPLLYHHWSGSWLIERQKEVDQDLMKDKELLFSKIFWKIV